MNDVALRYHSPPAVIDTVDGAMVMVENAYLALTEAVEFQATRHIANLAVAAAAFAREAKDNRLLSRATELRTRAERKAGQMLKQAADQEERAARGRPKTSLTGTFTPTLDDIGVTRKQASNWTQVAALSDAVFEQALQTTQAITHDISTPKVLRAMQQHKARESNDIEMDGDVVVEAPPKVASDDEQAVAFYNAVRALADVTCTVEQLKVALPSYQHFRISDNIGRALALLQRVNDTWTRT